MEEIAQRWKKTENDILRMAIKHDIVLSAYWEGPINVHEDLEDGHSFFKYSDSIIELFPIDGHSLMKLLTNALPVLVSVIHWDDGDLWYFATGSPDDSEERPYTSFNLTRYKIFTTLEQIEATETKYPQLTATVLSNNEAVIGHRIVSRKTSPAEMSDRDGITSTKSINQAIEKMYRYYYDKREYSFIKKDYVDAFIKKMRELLQKEFTARPKDEMELINYLAERIKTVEKVSNAWKITTEERELPAKKGVITNETSSSYTIIDVTKKLCLLRQKHQSPRTIPNP